MNLGKTGRYGRVVATWVAVAVFVLGGRAFAVESPLRPSSEPKAVVVQDDSASEAAMQPTPAKRPRPAAIEPLPAEITPARRPVEDDDNVGPIGMAGAHAESPAGESTTGEPTPQAIAAEESLKPIADPLESDAVEIEAASLKGVTPGVSTLAEVESAWGVPKEIRKVDGVLTHRYAVAPFNRIEVSFFEDKCTAIVVRLEKAFPADAVAKQLELDEIRPVFVSNEFGEVLGQSYPERGVLFTFVPSEQSGKASMQVSEIVLEPITAEPFVLRAEVTLDVHSRACLRDLDAAIKLDPKNNRAQWFRARVLNAAGDQEKAAAAIAAAVAGMPENPQYRITRAEILAQGGNLADAVKDLQKAIELSKSKPHVKARALCMLGDLLASGKKPDFKQAMEFHEAALKTAGAVADQKHPAVRIAAKEAMVDAYLGAANDIAWGNYSEKEKAVKVWLDLAAAAADDLIASEGAGEEIRFRAATRAIATCVGMRGTIDPAPWARVAVESGQKILGGSRDAMRRGRFEWELGVALYDAMQGCQLRRDQDAVARIGRQAVEHIEAAAEQRPTPATAYLLGRVYFRLGAMDAGREKNHTAAVVWFDKAMVQFAKPMPPEVAADSSRQGETLVIMGVSYWEVGQREQSVELTGRGVALLEQAVKQGVLAESSLAIPYGNLAAMHQQLGKTEAAGRYQKLASKAKSSNIK